MLSPERKRSLESKALMYASNLASADAAISYLESRGITEEVAEVFKLGFVPQGEEFAGRISIPYLGRSGCRDIKYRAIGDEKPKYFKEAGCGVNLYNAESLRDAALAVLCEGEFDAIAVQAYCGIPAVGYPGVATWSARENDFWHLCFEGVKKVIVIADGDSPGRNAAQKVADSIGWSARVVDLGDDMDASEYIALHGAEAFEERIGL